MKVLLPSLINDRLIDFPAETSWHERYKVYEQAGIDRNPFVKHLHKHGIEYRQYWINYEDAQKDWAKEHRANYRDSSWYLDILAAQIKEYKPDVIYNTTLRAFPYSFINQIKKELNQKPLWMCYYGVTRTGEFLVFKEYDIYLTGFHELALELERQYQKYYFFPHYFDDTLTVSESEFTKRNVPFSFIGGLTRKNNEKGFYRRRAIVEHLVSTANLEVWSEIDKSRKGRTNAIMTRFQALRYELFHTINNLPFPMYLLSKFPIISNVRNWEVRPRPEDFFNPRLSKKIKPPLFGKKMYEMLFRSKLTLNVHGQIDTSQGSGIYVAGNIRLFEATGSGACLLTDELPHLEKFFIPGKEIVTYENENDATEKANYLQNNPSERESIARLGHQRCIKENSATKRAISFASILKINC